MNIELTERSPTGDLHIRAILMQTNSAFAQHHVVHANVSTLHLRNAEK